MAILRMNAEAGLDRIRITSQEGIQFTPNYGRLDLTSQNSIQPAVCVYQGVQYNTGDTVCMDVTGQGIQGTIAVCGNRGRWTLIGTPCVLPGAAGVPAGGGIAAPAA